MGEQPPSHLLSLATQLLVPVHHVSHLALEPPVCSSLISVLKPTSKSPGCYGDFVALRDHSLPILSYSEFEIFTCLTTLLVPHPDSDFKSSGNPSRIKSHRFSKIIADY